MNKTININLAGLFFHIDEDAYNRLQKYLAAVRRSFSGTSGADEIMADIEARIAELFLENRANDQQVVSIANVESMIEIMGQPEDYEVDEEIFEEPRSTRKTPPYVFPQKKLYRDTVNGYVGGVSSGLGHYMGIDAIWVRVLWIILMIPSGGFIALIYILMWIVVPEAISSNDRLRMMGKEVNISNITDNARADFNEVTGEQAGASHGNSIGQKSKRGSVRFFNTIGKIIKGFFKVLLKLIGLVVFLTAVTALIGTIVSLVTVSFINIDGANLIQVFDIIVPADQSSWLLVTAVVLLLIIPLFALAVLGLRLLVSNMKSINMPVKIAMLLVWIAALIFVLITILNIAASQSYQSTYVKNEELVMDDNQAYQLEINEDANESISKGFYMNARWMEMVQYDGETRVSMDRLRTTIIPTTDSIASVKMIYLARGSSYEESKERAASIIYDYKISPSGFKGSDRIIIEKGTALADQKLKLIYRIPIGTKIKANKEFTRLYDRYLENDSFREQFKPNRTYEILEKTIKCLDCELEEQVDSLRTSTSGEWRYE
ncbi:MAG: PspC domain-containing protein [Nonlabens sp.]